jgi:predicted NAD/FAD-binding protein
MTSIAIIGTGIAGLGCGYLLQRDFDVTLFDGNGYAGGHTNTVIADEDDRQVAIDTGFMVFNQVTYPNLTRLFRELDVRIKPAPMSFGVQHLPSGIEYCGSSVGQLFARRRNALNVRYLAALYQIDRFNREADEALASSRFDAMTLEQYAMARGYGDGFLELYLLPICSAVWSTPFEDVRAFPVVTLLRFFRNHGLLGGLKGHHPWLTVDGGAKQYVEKMTRGFRDRIVLNHRVERVARAADGVTIRLADSSTRRFDRVIFACHADEALALLAAPTMQERELLGAFRYQRNVATLHTDVSPMPRRKAAWASWNYRIDRAADGRARATTIYWMNSLQGVSDRRNYFVSIDDPGLIDPSQVLKTIDYSHPVFTRDAIRAQRDLPSLNRLGPDQRTWYCGSYFRYGFHEDAFTSAIDAARAVSSNEDVWSEAA